MASRRVERVQGQVQQELAKLLLTEVKDPRLGAVTLTSVEMTPDLRIARVYYVSYEDDVGRAALEKAFKRARGFLRRELGQRLSLRYTPELELYYDDSGERGREMEALLAKLRETGQMGNDSGEEG